MELISLNCSILMSVKNIKHLQIQINTSILISNFRIIITENFHKCFSCQCITDQLNILNTTYHRIIT